MSFYSDKKTNPPKEFTQMDYQNGLYQGQHNGNHKEGLGCFCSDDGLLYIGIKKQKK